MSTLCRNDSLFTSDHFKALRDLLTHDSASRKKPLVKVHSVRQLNNLTADSKMWFLKLMVCLEGSLTDKIASFTLQSWAGDRSVLKLSLSTCFMI